MGGPMKVMKNHFWIYYMTNHRLQFTTPQLAMKSLRPEHFSASEVVLHTCGPTQTFAKYVPYRQSIK